MKQFCNSNKALKWTTAFMVCVASLGLVGFVATVYAAEPTAEDRAMEKFLLEAEVVEDEPLGVGITGSRKWVLRHNGVEHKAVFKDVDVYKAGNARDTNVGFMSNFSDSYKYDRAAYLLDRRLGLGRVPVVVVRDHNGTRGAVIEWLEGTVDEVARNAGIGPKIHTRSLQLQRSMMHAFDSLIWNDDRNIGNQLWTEDGEMRWIDHSRAFRLTKKVQPVFINQPARLTREFHENLKSLEFEELKTLLDGLMSNKRIKAILARRDKVLEKVEEDLRQYGPEVVYAIELKIEENPPEPGAESESADETENDAGN